MTREDTSTTTVDGARGHAMQFAVEDDRYRDYEADEPQGVIDEDLQDPEEACNVCGFCPCDCDYIFDSWKDRNL